MKKQILAIAIAAGLATSVTAQAGESTVYGRLTYLWIMLSMVPVMQNLIWLIVNLRSVIKVQKTWAAV